MHWLQRLLLAWLFGLLTGGLIVGTVVAVGTGELGALALWLLVPVLGVLTTWPVVILLAAIHQLCGGFFRDRPAVFGVLAAALALLFASSNLITFDALRDGLKFRANLFSIVAAPCAAAAGAAFWLLGRMRAGSRREAGRGDRDIA